MDMKRAHVLVDRPDNSYSTGQIVDRIGEEHFLVQFDNMHDGGRKFPAELFHIEEMAASAPDGLKCWKFFESATERQGWIDWLDSPAPPKVVNLVKK
jgi:hypothetical protein